MILFWHSILVIEPGFSVLFLCRNAKAFFNRNIASSAWILRLHRLKCCKVCWLERLTLKGRQSRPLMLLLSDMIQYPVFCSDLLHREFTISYLAKDDTGQEMYFSLLSDWDLDAAFLGASSPCLRLKVDLKPFEEGECAHSRRNLGGVRSHRICILSVSHSIYRTWRLGHYCTSRFFVQPTTSRKRCKGPDHSGRHHTKPSKWHLLILYDVVSDIHLALRQSFSRFVLDGEDVKHLPESTEFRGSSGSCSTNN